MSNSSLSSTTYGSSSSSTTSSLSPSSSSSSSSSASLSSPSPRKNPPPENLVPNKEFVTESEGGPVHIYASPTRQSVWKAGEAHQQKHAAPDPTPKPVPKGTPTRPAVSSGSPSTQLPPLLKIEDGKSATAGSKELPQQEAHRDLLDDEKERTHRPSPQDPKLSAAWELYEKQRTAFVETVLAATPKDSKERPTRTAEAGHLFDSTAESLDFQEALKLLQLYKKNVDPRLHSEVDRMLKTLAFYVKEGVSSEQLQALLDRTETWQSGRVWGQGLTVFTTGFFLLGAYQYINALHDDALVISSDPARADIEKFVWGCLIAGFGGVLGSNVIGKGGLAPGYFTPLAFGSDGKAYKDGKANDFTSTWRGKLTEYISFWGFSVGHSIVEAMFKDQPKDVVGKAAAKWASACAATLVTCLTKQYLPRLMLARDSMLLDASTPAKRQAIRALLDKPRTQEACTDLGDYLSAFGRGLKASIGMPSAPELVRAVLHSLSVGVALSPMLAAKTHPEHGYELAMAGSVFIGLYWGVGSRVARATIDQIKQAGVQEAARAQAKSLAAAEAERARESKHTVADVGDEEQGAKPPVADVTRSALQVSEIAPPSKRRCSPCNACVIV